MDNTKQCRCCKEDIPADASLCKYCRQPQSLFRALLPLQTIVVIAIFLGAYLYITETVSDSVAQFSGQAIYEGGDQLHIRDTSFRISKQGCEICIATMGTIANTTETAWTNIHFQVTYSNKSGEVVDVVNDEDIDLVVGPNAERRFKASGRASAEPAHYHSHKVEITKASPDHSWY